MSEMDQSEQQDQQDQQETGGHDPATEREQVAQVDDELDARAEGDGLAAEAGRGEETGLAEG